ncbi:MAG: tetratricopeptide repeat protein [Gammaproteobacteria bacterium]
MLVLAATAFQNLHRFDTALGLIDRALHVEPQNSQALLTKATILQVQGRFDEARPVCRTLIQAAGQLIALTCLTSVNSLTGHLSTSYRALQAVFVDDARLPVELRTWVLGQLGDMAVRAGDPREAEGHFRAALRAHPEDLYGKAAYADLLLSEHRPEEVVNLLRDNEAQDNLLLRLAIAGTRAQIIDGRRWSELFRARFEAARRDGDFTHLREQARYFIDVRAEPQRALELALANWRVQHEPDDIRIYVRAAAAAGEPEAQRTILDWIRSTHYEDATLTAQLPPTAGPLAP